MAKEMHDECITYLWCLLHRDLWDQAVPQLLFSAREVPCCGNSPQLFCHPLPFLRIEARSVLHSRYLELLSWLDWNSSCNSDGVCIGKGRELDVVLFCNPIQAVSFLHGVVALLWGSGLGDDSSGRSSRLHRTEITSDKGAASSRLYKVLGLLSIHTLTGAQIMSGCWQNSRSTSQSCDCL